MTISSFNQPSSGAAPTLAEIPLRHCLPGEGLAALPANSRVLVIRLRSMGDTILLTPALRLLHEWRPDLQISVLLDRPWNELLEGNPAVRQTIVSAGKLSTLQHIRREKFAAVINLHGGPTSAQLSALSGAVLRIGMAQFRSHSAYNLLVPRMEDILPPESGASALRFHTAEHAAAVLGWLGMPLRVVPPAQLFPTEAARATVQERLGTKAAPGEGAYAVIHAAGLYPSKRWSPAGFSEIGRHLADRHKLRVVLLGAESDAALLEEIRQGVGAGTMTAIGWPISELLALIGGARVFLGNDSGPAHAAAALGVPTAVIFGSSSSSLWGPWRASAAAVIQNPFDCNPCAGDHCHAFAEPRCIQSIEAEQVRSALDRLLAPTTVERESHAR